MEKSISMNWSLCCLCRNWNNGRGADSFRMNGPFSGYVDNLESHQCMLNGHERKSLDKCNKFAKR